VDPVVAVQLFGGAARWSQLREHITWSQLQRAVSEGELVGSFGGTYSLPSLLSGVREARRLRGVLSHLSAAAYWDLRMVAAPDRVHVTVAPNATRRNVPSGLSLYYRAVTRAEGELGVTSIPRTVLDCARDLPLREAVAVGDSALRRGHVDVKELMAASSRMRGPGSGRVRKIVERLDGRATNPFESALRAILLGGGIECFEPQLEIRGSDGLLVAQCDLGCRRCRVVLEAESFAHHGHRSALARDCRRYAEVGVRGWLVLRFAWEHVMFDEAWVLSMVQAALRRR
jgi:very-short-patch-repair endonuclease